MAKLSNHQKIICRSGFDRNVYYSRKSFADNEENSKTPKCHLYYNIISLASRYRVISLLLQRVRYTLYKTSANVYSLQLIENF